MYNFIKNRKESFDQLVKWYIFANILASVLFIIAPINRMIMYTPLYHYQRYFALIGCVIILIDVLFYRVSFKTKNIWWLYFFVIVASLSAILNISYGYKENLFDIIWMLIQFSLFYTYTSRVGQAKFEAAFKKMFNIVALIWFFACATSIVAFLFDYGHYILANPYVKDFYMRQGFIEGRLFGNFTSIFNGAFISALLFVIAIYLYRLERKKYLLGYAFIFMLYIILSGTRGTILSLFVLLFISLLYRYYKRFSKKRKSIISAVLSLVVSILITSSVFYGLEVSKVALSKVPNIPVLKNNRPYYASLINQTPFLVGSGSGNATVKENILKREDTSGGNISNNRFNIWLSYLSLYQDIGFVGLSSGNYAKYLIHHDVDTFVVNHVKLNMPEHYKSNQVYAPHSAYVALYVNTGLVGFLTIMLFLMNSLRMVIAYLKGKVTFYFYPIISLLLLSLVAMLFDTIVFFYNDVMCLTFWLGAGYISYITHHKKQLG